MHFLILFISPAVLLRQAGGGLPPPPPAGGGLPPAPRTAPRPSSGARRCVPISPRGAPPRSNCARRCSTVPGGTTSVPVALVAPRCRVGRLPARTALVVAPRPTSSLLVDVVESCREDPPCVEEDTATTEANNKRRGLIFMKIREGGSSFYDKGSGCGRK